MDDPVALASVSLAVTRVAFAKTSGRIEILLGTDTPGNSRDNILDGNPDSHPRRFDAAFAILLRSLIAVPGGLAIAVPGEVHGHYTAWQKFGRLPWFDLVAPTIVLCEKGFVVERSLAQAIRQYEDTVRNDSNFAYVDTSDWLAAYTELWKWQIHA